MKAEGTVCLLALEVLKSATILQIFGPPRLPAGCLGWPSRNQLGGAISAMLSEARVHKAIIVLRHVCFHNNFNLKRTPLCLRFSQFSPTADQDFLFFSFDNS